ncbi:TITAN-like protein, partial [Mucuna pruriens]
CGQYVTSSPLLEPSDPTQLTCSFERWEGKRVHSLIMGEQHENESRRRKTQTNKKSEYEFCKACNINHNQGLRHKYFPNHKKSLSTFLSRFRNKLSDVRVFLNTPAPLSPQQASRNRFWCVFCDQDIDQNSTSFARANAIRHLASAEHVKNLKHFFWKYGGPADQLDAFMVSDDDVTKWEERCVVARKDETSEGSRRSDDIHNQLNSGNIDSFENVYSHSVKSYPSNDVLPLQYYTNEYHYQVSCSGLSGDANVATDSGACSGANTFALQDFAGMLTLSIENVIFYSLRLLSTYFLLKGEAILSPMMVDKGRVMVTHVVSSSNWLVNSLVHDNGRMISRESSHHGLQMLTQISSVSTESAGENVYSGAPPPWFEATEGVQMHSKPVLGDTVSHSNKLGKSKKLDPKRVGAAWVEKRKIEIEKEKRGETLRNECDANWLPNFGRVWQSGSRRESRKEFEKEKQKLNVETQSELPIKIQPYVSKRMRMDSGGDYASR